MEQAERTTKGQEKWRVGIRALDYLRRVGARAGSAAMRKIRDGLRALASPYVLALIALIGIVSVANAVWLAQDSHVPQIDEIGYFRASLAWMKLLSSPPDSLLAFMDRALDIKFGARPSLYMLLPVPFLYLFGRSLDIAVFFANLLCTTALVFATYGIGKRLFGASVGLLAAFAVAINPEVIYLSRLFFSQFGIIGASAVAVYFLMRTENFTRISYCLAFGLSVAIAALIRHQFVLQLGGITLLVAGQSLYLAIRRMRTSPNGASWKHLSRVGRNLLLAGLLMGILAGPWYARHVGYLLFRVGLGQSPYAQVDVGSMKKFEHCFQSLMDLPISKNV